MSASYAGFLVLYSFSEHAEALELRALPLYERLRKIRALPAQLGYVELPLVFAQLLDDLVLYRQPVAVPARDIGGREAPHRLVAQYGVFQNLVERRSDVHVAVGEGRAVVQDEFRGARARLLNFFVQSGFLPVLYARGLAPHEVAAHGEFCVGKV